MASQLDPSLSSNFKTKSPTRFLKGCTGARRLPAGGGSSVVGEVAAEHEQGRAHTPVALAQPEVERGAPATCAGGLGRAAPW